MALPAKKPSLKDKHAALLKPAEKKRVRKSPAKKKKKVATTKVTKPKK